MKNPEVKVGDLAKQAGAEIVSFVRYEVGEGIERPKWTSLPKLPLK